VALAAFHELENDTVAKREQAVVWTKAMNEDSVIRRFPARAAKTPAA